MTSVVGLLVGDHKLIHDPIKGRCQLYDLKADPPEKNLAKKEPELLASMQEGLVAVLAGERVMAWCCWKRTDRTPAAVRRSGKGRTSGR